jgi:hypothetical protein
MAKDDEERDFQDVRTEETTRGTRRPKRVVSLAKQRAIRRLAQMLANPECNRDVFLEAIRAFGLHEQSEEYQKLLALWERRHGSRR